MKKSTEVLEMLIGDFLQNKKSGHYTLLDKFSDKIIQQNSWNESEMGQKEKVKTEILSNIHQHLGLKQQSTKIRIKHLWTAAASIILLLGVSILWHYSNSRYQWLYVNTEAQMDSILLADGSKVYLSPHTEFAYPKHFRFSKREVQLKKGNAFFEVSHNAGKPFVVVCDSIETTVLGTSFNVQIGENECQVTVHTGMVKVASTTASVTLTPYEQACFQYHKHQLLSRNIQHQSLLPWYKSSIDLQQVPLKDILAVVQKKYGVDIKTPDNAGDLSHKATVHIYQNSTLQSVIQQINYITSLNFETYERNLEN